MSFFPSQAEIGQARQDAEELLPATCQILTLTEQNDGAGSVDEVWTPSADTACRLASVGKEPAGMTADRVDETSTHVITLPYGTTIDTTSRISLDGETWAVTARRRRTDQDTFVLRVEVKEVKD